MSVYDFVVISLLNNSRVAYTGIFRDEVEAFMDVCKRFNLHTVDLLMKERVVPRRKK